MKRLFDIVLAATFLLITVVPMVLIALAVWFLDGLPVLFHQTRVGRAFKPFQLHKFRTMVPGPAGTAQLTVGCDPRITPLGAWLRQWHLDELPQLWNILVGEMSFVGPRPEMPEYVDKDDPVQQAVYGVRPGLLDPATLCWLDEPERLASVADWRGYYVNVVLPDKLERSLEYIRRRSLGSDLALLIRASVLVVQHGLRHRQKR